MANFLARAVDTLRGYFRKEREVREQSVSQSRAKDFPRPFDPYLFMGADVIGDYLRLDRDLISRYLDYENMSNNAIMAAALDIYCDDCCQSDLMTGKTIWGTSENQEVVESIDELLQNRLRVEDDAWGICYTLCQYGSAFEEAMVADGKGVIGFNHLPSPSIRRYEKGKGILVGFLQDPTGSFQQNVPDLEAMLSGEKPTPSNLAVFEDWQVLHWRLRSKNRFSPYGFGIFEAARAAWRRLVLMEDAMLVFKISRAPSRYAFYVDVGDLPPKQAFKHLQRIKNEYKKKSFVDPATGQINERAQLLGFDQDFFFPVRAGAEAVKVDVLTGPNYQAIDDVNYFQDKIFAALKVPKAYLTFEEDLGGKGTLAHEDIRFARTVMRIQRELRNGYKRAVRVDMVARGIDPNSVPWDVFMTVPSGAYEAAQMEIRKTRSELADSMAKYVSERWLMREVLGFSDDQIDLIRREKALEETGEMPEMAQSASPEAMEARKAMSPGKVKKLTEHMDDGNRKHERQLKESLSKILEDNKELKKMVFDLRGFAREFRASGGFQNNGHAG